MQSRSRTLLKHLPSPFASIGLAVAQGGVCSLGVYLIFGVSSAIPICIALAIAVAKQARSVEEHSTQQQAGHALEVQKLNLALKHQQEEHLAVIRKMKLEQNEVLLKYHELEVSLRQS
ncbi:TPA: hypothetical protein ACH3X3_008995 [Trebouxia sp. C0006]